MTDTSGFAVATTENAAVENGTSSRDKNGNGNVPILPILESDKEKEERRRSLWIVYFTMFLISLGFSIVLTGIWPYLDKVCLAVFLMIFNF
jgi:hypothetical protein